MKTLTDYFYEAKKNYEFRVKFANVEPGKDFDLDKFKAALETYGLVNTTEAKRIPMQANMLDFGQLGACEVYVIDVTVEYPVIDQQLKQVIYTATNVPMSNFAVMTKCFDEGREQAEEAGKDHEGALLDKPYKKTEADKTGQKLVGEKRKDALTKNLKTRKYQFAVKPEPQVKQPTQQGDISPVGTTQNKIPSPKK
jgi:hypothetical protein